jgi:transglutaminase-like putative cysteine protease
MTIRYDITHTTLYRYSKPVSFGEHRVMFRPRDSHDLRVLATDLQVSPEAIVRMIQDPHSNSVAWSAAASQRADRLYLPIEHAPGKAELERRRAR